MKQSVREGIMACMIAGLVYEDRFGKLLATDHGKIIAGKGLQVATGSMLLQFIETMENHVPHPLEFLHLAGITPDGDESYINLSTQEHREGIYVRQFRAAI